MKHIIHRPKKASIIPVVAKSRDAFGEKKTRISNKLDIKQRFEAFKKQHTTFILDLAISYFAFNSAVDAVTADIREDIANDFSVKPELNLVLERNLDAAMDLYIIKHILTLLSIPQSELVVLYELLNEVKESSPKKPVKKTTAEEVVENLGVAITNMNKGMRTPPYGELPSKEARDARKQSTRDKKKV